MSFTLRARQIRKSFGGVEEEPVHKRGLLGGAVGNGVGIDAALPAPIAARRSGVKSRCSMRTAPPAAGSGRSPRSRCSSERPRSGRSGMPNARRPASSLRALPVSGAAARRCPRAAVRPGGRADRLRGRAQALPPAAKLGNRKLDLSALDGIAAQGNIKVVATNQVSYFQKNFFVSVLPPEKKKAS